MTITYVTTKIREKEKEELYSFLCSSHRALCDKLGCSYEQFARYKDPEKFKEIEAKIKERRRRLFEDTP